MLFGRKGNDLFGQSDAVHLWHPDIAEQNRQSRVSGKLLQSVVTV